MLSRLFAALIFCFSLTALAQSTQVCAWLVETAQPDNVYSFDIWLQADAKLDFLYKIGGAGVVTDSGKFHSPGSGTFALNVGKAEKVWGFGVTMDPPAKIDIGIELHQTPADIFSEAPTPLLAKFSFSRAVPESEKKPPPTLAKKQCSAVKKEK